MWSWSIAIWPGSIARLSRQLLLAFCQLYFWATESHTIRVFVSLFIYSNRQMNYRKLRAYSCVYIYIYKRCYLYNIFTTNYRWLAVIGSNLKLILNYIFVPTITTSNNLSLRICCKNVVDISFLSLHIYIKMCSSYT